MMCLMNWRWAVELDPLGDMAKWQNGMYIFFFFNLHAKERNHLHSLIAYERKSFDRTNFGQRDEN